MKKYLCAAAALSCFTLFAQANKTETTSNESGAKEQQTKNADTMNGSVQASQSGSSSVTGDKKIEISREEREFQNHNIPGEPNKKEKKNARHVRTYDF